MDLQIKRGPDHIQAACDGVVSKAEKGKLLCVCSLMIERRHQEKRQTARNDREQDNDPGHHESAPSFFAPGLTH